MKNILMITDPFGFGPTGSLMSNRLLLNGLDLNFILIGYEYTRGIVDSKKFENCIFLKENNLSDLKKEVLKHIDWCDTIWISTEFRLNDIFEKYKKNLIVYDPLYWFWSTPPFVISKKLTYICQNFFGVRDRVSKLKINKRKQYFIVSPPIIKTSSPVKKIRKGKKKLLINFCGFYNYLLTLDGYGNFIIDNILKLYSSQEWFEIVVVGNSSFINKIKIDNEIFKFKTLSHSQMLKEIEKSDLLLSCPGLNSTMESISLNTPVAFLPPQNFSQKRQLDYYTYADIVLTKLDWFNLMELNIDINDMDESLAIKKIFDVMKECFNSVTCKNKFEKSLSEILNYSTKDLEIIQIKQRNYLNKLINESDYTSVKEILLEVKDK